MFGESLGFKSEYRTDGEPDAYCVESGEYFWGGVRSFADRRNLQVRPAYIQVTNPTP